MTPYLLPHLRVELVLGRILTTRWDAETWAVVRELVPRALELRRQARAGRLVELTTRG